jgi:hypothetical protein
MIGKSHSVDPAEEVRSARQTKGLKREYGVSFATTPMLAPGTCLVNRIYDCTTLLL